MLDLEETFANILREKTVSDVKQTSLVTQWLGMNYIPQSLSIRLGNYLEELFNTMLGAKNILHELERRGNNYYVRWQDEWHQVDILARVGDKIYTREMKLNISLGRGPCRDIRYREQAVGMALAQKYGCKIDSDIFCPFVEVSHNHTQLNHVEGLREFIAKFDMPFTVDDFLKLGHSPQIHRLLDI